MPLTKKLYQIKNNYHITHHTIQKTKYMPTAEPAQDAPPPHSPSRNSQGGDVAQLVVNSSMDDDVSKDDDNMSEDLLLSPTPSTNDKDESHDETDDNNDDDIVIGELDEKLDPDSGRCMSCLVHLRDTAAATCSTSPTSSGRGFLYTTHEHPLLNVMVCSVCEERAEAVESDVIDIELGDTTSNVEMNACSW